MDIWKRVELSGAGEPGIYFNNDKDEGYLATRQRFSWVFYVFQ